MGDFTFACPNCLQHLEASDDMQGQQIACPMCNKPIVVPRRTARPTVIPIVKTTRARRTGISSKGIASIIVGAVLIAGTATFLLLLNTPERKVKKTLSAYLNATFCNNSEVEYGFASSSDKKAKTFEAFELEKRGDPFESLRTNNVSYTIDSVAVADREAIAYATITMPDFEKTIEEFQAAALEAALSMNKREMDLLERKAMEKIQSKKAPIKTDKKKFHLVLEDAKWMIFLDWERLAKEEEKRAQLQALLDEAKFKREERSSQIQALLSDAKRLKRDSKPQEAIEVYSKVLQLDGDSSDAQGGMNEAKLEIENLRLKQEYMRNVELYDFEAKYFKPMFEEKTPGVTFKLRNNGDRSLSEVKVSVFFRDRNNKVISEDYYYPVNSSSWSSDSRAPLKPNYIWQLERGKLYTAKSVPDEWQEGNAIARITDIEFAK